MSQHKETNLSHALSQARIPLTTIMSLGIYLWFVNTAGGLNFDTVFLACMFTALTILFIEAVVRSFRREQ